MTVNPEQPPVLEDDSDDATVTQIPTEFNEQSEPELTQEQAPTDEQPPVETKADKVKAAFMNWAVEKNEMIQQRGLAFVQGMGKAGLMLMDTWQNPDLSVEKKVEGTLAAGVSAAGEIVKASVLMGPAAGLISMMPGETAPKIVDSFVGGAVDSATDLLIKKNKDGSVGFNEEAVAQFASKKGLIGVGINAAVAGVGSAMNTASDRSDMYLDKNPDSKYAGAAKLVKNANEVYKSPFGVAMAGAAASAATKRFTR